MLASTGITLEPVVSSAMAIDIAAAHACLLQRCAHGLDQRVHLVVMRLRRVVGIVAAAMQRIFRGRGAEPSAHLARCIRVAVEQRHANAQCAEIDACYDRHVCLDLRLIVVVHVPAE